MPVKKILLFLSVTICFSALCSFRSSAQAVQISPLIAKQSFIYAVKGSDTLGLDVYTLKGSDTIRKKSCVIFVFGGAFVGGRRDDSVYNNYFNSLVENNQVVVSISYRLGLRGVQHLSKFNLAPLRNAVDMAMDDLYDATNWVIRQADSLAIDTSKIMLSGSSSGAITVLTADFNRRNEKPPAAKLPANFEYAALITFSGAVLSFDGSLSYKIPPCPYLMFHGTADKIVPYEKIRFFNKGFYGSAWIAKILAEKNQPYYLYSELGMGHEIAVLPMYDKIPVILDFLDQYVRQQKPLQISLSFKDPDIKPMMLLTPEELFKKLQENKMAADPNK